MRSAILALAMVFLFSGVAQAQLPKYITDAFYRRQEAKKKTRWTIEDWLDTKRKISLMDQWLAMNSSANLFELVLAGLYGNYNLKYPDNPGADLSSENVSGAHLMFFMNIFGVDSRYEKWSDDQSEVLTSAVHLRLLGTSEQSTHLTAFYGVRQFRYEPTDSRFTSPVVGGRLTLYLTKHIGLTGSYSQYLKHESSDDREFSGSRTAGGLFIEALFMRVFAEWFSEKSVIKDATEFQREGIVGGLGFYF